MTGDRGYSRLAGLLLLWAVVPLPFLYIVMPPFWLAAGSVALVLALRPSWSRRLPAAVQNAIAIAIVLAVLAAGGVRVGPLRPLGHLLLLVTAVRALQVVDRRSFLRTLPAIFLVWVISLTSSTHVTVLMYFAASAALWWWVGMQIHLLGILPRDRQGTDRGVDPRHAAAAAAAALLLAVPVFVAMPRLHAPWIAGRGGASSVTGFSSRVQLSALGTIQESQERALVVRSENGRRVAPEWLRLRATGYERVTVESWAPRPVDRRQPLRSGLIRLSKESASSDETTLEIILDRPREYLFVPEGTVAVEVADAVRIDPAGGLVLARPPDGPLSYRVTVTDPPVRRHLDPPREGGIDFSIHPAVRALAERVTAGIEDDADRAAAIEAHLQSEFTYSLTGVGGNGPDPVARFLLSSRTGHCEYFAGGMVVLLDALGIPSRMAAGYSGGAASATGNEVVVRESNAHAWVEVWLGLDRGWVAYDPTPASGVPGLARVSAGDRLRFVWEWVQASWDRYVLTFGLGEQVELLAAAGNWLSRLAASVRWRDVAWLVAAIVLLWCLRLTLQLARRRSRRTRGARPRSPAARAVRRLAGLLQRDGVSVPDSATVRWIGRTARYQWPAAAQAASDLVWLAERELYAPDGSVYGAAEVRRVWGDLRRGMRQS